jgi:hypothetical protein
MDDQLNNHREHLCFSHRRMAQIFLIIRKVSKEEGGTIAIPDHHNYNGLASGVKRRFGV